MVVLLSVEFSTVSCDTFYIVTSPSSPCPGEYIGVPCLTLQQYASNPSRSQNVTFIIEPGMYNLSTVLTVSDVYNFTMSSTNATVTRTSATARFEFIRVENVHINGMTFMDGNTAINMSQVTSATIVSSNFINNQGNRGGCLYIESSSVIISESEFQNNRAIMVEEQFIPHHQWSQLKDHSSVTTYKHLTTLVLEEGQYMLHPPISLLMSQYLLKTLHMATIYEGGGAIRTCCSGILQVINTTFIGTYNTYGYSTGVSGGAIYTTGLSVTVIQCQFINNYVTGAGGGIYHTGGSLTITECNFFNNIAGGSGGGIYKTGGNLTVTECNFLNNISHLCILLYYNKWGITVIYSLPEGYKGIYDPYIPPCGYYFDQPESLF